MKLHAPQSCYMHLVAASTPPALCVALQVWNHTFFWESMKPNGGGDPTGKLAEAINASFGSLDEFKAQFKNAGAIAGLLRLPIVQLCDQGPKMQFGCYHHHRDACFGSGQPSGICGPPHTRGYTWQAAHQHTKTAAAPQSLYQTNVALARQPPGLIMTDASPHRTAKGQPTSLLQ